MRTVITKEVTHALAIQTRELLAVWKLLQENYSDLRLSAACSDGSILESNDINELLAYENPNYRYILKLELSARSSLDERFRLSYSNDSNTTAKLFIESQKNKEAFHLISEMLNLIHEARPMWSPITRIKASTSLIGIGMVLGMWSSIQHLIGPFKQPEALSHLTGIDLLYLGVLEALVFFALVWPIDKFQSWLFPRITFIIGRQEDEWQNRNRYRSIVFSGFALSVISSVIGSVVYEHLN
ncbi:MAG: hypothetical protein EPN17_09835 [Methylobacter sp.]|nr:MAG: hypothetical protein EPN17_09835 [Methylobacter sp.]